jgi:hypothetical protein
MKRERKDQSEILRYAQNDMVFTVSGARQRTGMSDCLAHKSRKLKQKRHGEKKCKVGIISLLSGLCVLGAFA